MTKGTSKCMCGNPSVNPNAEKEKDFWGSFCSKNCSNQMYSVMKAIKNAQKKQGSNTIRYGLTESLDAQRIYKKLQTNQ
jgi:hypothetical protein